MLDTIIEEEPAPAKAAEPPLAKKTPVAKAPPAKTPAPKTPPAKPPAKAKTSEDEEKIDALLDDWENK